MAAEPPAASEPPATPPDDPLEATKPLHGPPTDDPPTALLLPPPRRALHKHRRKLCALVLGLAAATVVVLCLSLTAADDTPAVTSWDVLIIAHDAGESLSLSPALTELAQTSPPPRIAVLALGEPATTIFSSTPGISLTTLEQLGYTQNVADGTERNATLPSVAAAAAYFGTPRIAIAGMAYVMQAQLLAAFRASGSHAVAIDDAIGSAWRPASVVTASFFGPSPSALALDELWMGDAVTAGNVSSWLGEEGLEGAVEVVLTGSGTLGSWREAADDTSQVAATRRAVLGAAWPPSTVVVVYAGGYGGDEYSAALQLFCAAVTRFSDGFGFVFSPHPGYPSSYEASLFDGWGCNGSSLQVVGSSGGPLDKYSTAQLVAASNASLSLDSTVGPQSLAIGIPHGYVTDQYMSLWSELGLIPRAPSAEALVQVLNETFRAEGFRVAGDVMAAAGVPTNGTANQLRRLRELLGGVLVTELTFI